MKKSWMRTIVMVSALLTICVSTGTSLGEPLDTTEESLAEEALAWILDLKGNVQVKDPGSQKPAAGFVGRSLEIGSEIWTGEDASASILSRSGDLLSLPDNSHMIATDPLQFDVKGMALGSKIDSDNGSRVAQLLGRRTSEGMSSGLVGVRSTSEDLVLLYPRSSWLKGIPDEFRWDSDTPNVRSSFELIKGKEVLFSKEVSGNSVDFPSDGPELPSETSIFWEVSTFVDEKPIARDRGFFLILPEERLRKVTRIEEEIRSTTRKQELSGVAECLLLVSCYQEFGLMHDAEKVLRATLEKHPELSVLRELLARTYAGMGLQDLAREQLEFLPHSTQSN